MRLLYWYLLVLIIGQIAAYLFFGFYPMAFIVVLAGITLNFATHALFCNFDQLNKLNEGELKSK